GPLNAAERRALRDLAALFALDLVEQHLGEFREEGLLSAAEGRGAGRRVGALCDALRPHAVVLVDCWAFSDAHLGSALGRADGEAYRALFDRALREPLNQEDVTEGYKKYLFQLINPNAKL
ncbi:unnamed protein product, partial [Heterosigma akashiwo]